MSQDVRHHGYDDDPLPTAPPRLVLRDNQPTRPDNLSCPACEGDTLFWVEIDYDNKLLKGGKAIGTYVGCAACKYASAMVSRART